MTEMPGLPAVLRGRAESRIPHTTTQSPPRCNRRPSPPPGTPGVGLG